MVGIFNGIRGFTDMEAMEIATRTVKILLLFGLVLSCARSYAQNSQIELYLQNQEMKFPLESFIQDYRQQFPPPQSEFTIPPIGGAEMYYSRSLQKKSTSVPNPRVLYSLLDSDPVTVSQPIPSTFIGHTASNGGVEVISWNRQTREYDFFEAKGDGSNGSARLLRSNRETCVACHQNGGPIFPRGPWSESSFNPEVSRQSIQLRYRNLIEYLKIELRKRGQKLPKEILQMKLGTLQNSEQILESVKARLAGFKDIDKILDPKLRSVSDFLSTTVNNSLSFDLDVRNANDRLLMNNVCKNLCGSNDQTCKTALMRAMAMSALAEYKETDADTRKAARESSSLQDVLRLLQPKAQSLSLPSSVLPDRLVDPKTGNSKILSIALTGKEKLDDLPQLSGSPLSLGVPSFASSVVDSKKMGLVAQMMARDPDYIQYDNQFARVGSEDMISNANKRSGRIEAGFEYKFVEKGLDRLDPKFPRPKTTELTGPFVQDYILGGLHLCFDPTPQSMEKIQALSPAKIDKLSSEQLEAIFFAAGTSLTCTPQSLVPDSASLSLKQIANQALEKTTFSGNKRQRRFHEVSAVCANCHDASFIPLPSADVDGFLKFKGPTEGKTVLEMIREEQMPPAASKYKISNEERKAWLKDLDTVDSE